MFKLIDHYYKIHKYETYIYNEFQLNVTYTDYKITDAHFEDIECIYVKDAIKFIQFMNTPEWFEENTLKKHLVPSRRLHEEIENNSINYKNLFFSDENIRHTTHDGKYITYLEQDNLFIEDWTDPNEAIARIKQSPLTINFDDNLGDFHFTYKWKKEYYYFFPEEYRKKEVNDMIGLTYVFDPFKVRDLLSEEGIRQVLKRGLRPEHQTK